MIVTGLSAITAVHCEQCATDCKACAIGQVHMNDAPFAGDTRDLEAVRQHNMAGHHHIMWNGSENEMHPCGSPEGDVLAEFTKYSRDVEASVKENTRQVGGSHYGLSKFQHWDMVDLFKLDYFQGQVTKYVMRWRDKNGIQDLEKAQHFLEKYIALEKKKLENASPETQQRIAYYQTLREG